MRTVNASMFAAALSAMAVVGSGPIAGRPPLYRYATFGVSTPRARGPSRHAHSIATRKQRAAARKHNRGGRT